MLLACDTIGVKICELVCDRGGRNEGFMHSVADELNLDKKKPDDTSVSLTHPLDKERKIFLWSCGTHSIKALRNNLYRS